MYQNKLYLLVQIVPMSVFSDNIRHLREKKGISQQKLANDLIITRERLAKYETGRSEPPLEILKRISKYFHLTLDVLVNANLKRISEDSLMKMEDNRILLPITVDKQGKDNVEVVGHKAKAGYLNGYSDPEFIEELEQMRIPFLKQGKFRAFPIEGDSMPPHGNGTFIVAKYLDRLSDIQEGKTYIILSKDDGVVYKRITKRNKKINSLTLNSDNPAYLPYEIKIQSILEIWEYAISMHLKEFTPNTPKNENIPELLKQLQYSINSLHEKM